MRRFIILLVFILITNLFSYNDFKFVILGDRTGSHVEGAYESVIEKSLSEGANFYITVGDQIEGYNSNIDEINSEWDEYFNILKKVPVGVYLIPGNHDIWGDQSEVIWKERIGKKPNYSFDYEGVHFLVLDTSRYEDYDAMPQTYFEWVKEDLSLHKDARLTFVFFHKPLWFDTIPECKEDKLHQLFKDTGVDAVFNGHFHTYCSGTYDGIFYTVIGSSGGAITNEFMDRGNFFQYGVVNVEGNEFSLTIVPLKSEERLPIDYIAVSDIKFFDKIETEYIALQELFVDEKRPNKWMNSSVAIKNIYSEPLKLDIEIDTKGTDWKVKPDFITTEISPNEIKLVDFKVKYKKELYPLPSVVLEYPYGKNKIYNYKSPIRLTRTLYIGRAISEQTVDGKIGQQEWLGAFQPVKYFCSPNGDKNQLEDTKFHFCYDDENLYIIAICSQKDIKTLKADTTQRDGVVYKDDCVGFFIAPFGVSGDAYQIYFNPNGVIFDQMIFINELGEIDVDVSWNVDCKVATLKNEHWWSCEVAIPFSSLNVTPPVKGDLWRINFRRKETSLNSSADWQFPISYDINYFGRAEFIE
ncbi:MAG: metallophosphoesterase [bacterium]